MAIINLRWNRRLSPDVQGSHLICQALGEVPGEKGVAGGVCPVSREKKVLVMTGNESRLGQTFSLQKGVPRRKSKVNT